MTAETNDRNRWMALYVLCGGMLMIVLDATIVNVALPSIKNDLSFSQNNLAWVVNAYLIAFGGLLLLAGRIGDLIGQRRIFLIGLAVFTAASLLCAVAQSQVGDFHWCAPTLEEGTTCIPSWSPKAPVVTTFSPGLTSPRTSVRPSPCTPGTTAR